MKFLSSSCLFATAAAFTAVCAAPIATEELADKVGQGFRLLDLEEGAEPVWKTEDEKLELLRSNVHFFDVTEVYDPEETVKPARFAAKVTFPAPSHEDEVNPIIETLSTSNLETYLNKLTSFNNRYYKSSTGKDASQYIFDTLSGFAQDRSDITISKFNHTWTQFSVIARFEGESDGPVTIVGAHEDSINLSNPMDGRAPGADDDGSGTVNLIEIFRALVAADFKPSTPLEFQWYSGEEGGLLGSQAIAKDYQSRGVDVKAFLELDMTAYFAPGTKEIISIMPDYVDSGVTAFIKQLVDTYSTLDWVVDSPCGYACSDHASWYKQGYPTGLVYEASYGNSNDNPRVHSSGDTTSVNGFSWSHSLEFTKVALGFAYELTV
ncbi:aminopeptidase [Fomes fomentarius]|nr:aminopeptidase [Fomes fomentarius]